MKKLQGLLMILLFASGTLLAQKKTISGKVTGQAGNDPLLGVNILANNQKGGTASKQDGTYSITVDSKTTTLIFSFVGYNYLVAKVEQVIFVMERSTLEFMDLLQEPTR